MALGVGPNPIYLASIALSGTSGNLDNAVDPDNEILTVRVSAQYAAVAATSGLNIAVYYSLDGSTFVQFGTTQKLAPAATVLGVAVVPVGIKSLLGPVQKVRVVLTNTDGTNAVLAHASIEAYR